MLFQSARISHIYVQLFIPINLLQVSGINIIDRGINGLSYGILSEYITRRNLMLYDPKIGQYTINVNIFNLCIILVLKCILGVEGSIRVENNCVRDGKCKD